MILPVYTYGNAVLRKESEEITADYPDLRTLVDNMYETMYHADGVGLAAPQIGLDIRLLVIDLAPYKEEDPELGNFKVTMVNPQMLEMSEETVMGEEGCLSLPGIHESVPRAKRIKITYRDVDFNEHTEVFEDYKARVVQHEYDHIDGIVFTDRIAPIRKNLIRSKLAAFTKGKWRAAYRCKLGK